MTSIDPAVRIPAIAGDAAALLPEAGDASDFFAEIVGKISLTLEVAQATGDGGEAPAGDAASTLGVMQSAPASGLEAETPADHPRSTLADAETPSVPVLQHLLEAIGRSLGHRRHAPEPEAQGQATDHPEKHREAEKRLPDTLQPLGQLSAPHIPTTPPVPAIPAPAAAPPAAAKMVSVAQAQVAAPLPPLVKEPTLHANFPAAQTFGPDAKREGAALPENETALRDILPGGTPAGPDAPRLHQAVSRFFDRAQSRPAEPAISIAAQTLPVPSLAADVAPIAVSQPILPVAATTPAAAAPPAADAIDRQLDVIRDSAWLDNLAREISDAADAGGTSLRFRLHPAHLGALRVEISQDAQGAAVRLSVDSEAARNILTDAQPRLLQEARAQGLRIAETHVDLGGSGTGDPRRQAPPNDAPVRTARVLQGEAERDGKPTPSRSERFA